LVQEGYEMKSAVADHEGLQLTEGVRVHPSDIKAQYIARAMDEGKEPSVALAEMFYALPSEAVALLLTLSRPDAISWARLNFPMHLSFSSHGAYLATVPLAIPEDGGEALLLPALCSGYVFADGYTCRRFPRDPASVAPITPKVWTLAYERIEDAIKNGKTRGFGPLFEKEFPLAECTQRNAVTWRVISELKKEGKIRVETQWLPGLVEGARVPKSHMIWVKDEERGEV